MKLPQGYGFLSQQPKVLCCVWPIHLSRAEKLTPPSYLPIATLGIKSRGKGPKLEYRTWPFSLTLTD